MFALLLFMCVITRDEFIEKNLRGTTVYRLPAEIIKLHLTNIMRFRSFTLSLDKMNLIFGNVGTGKTSIIQSIAAMFNRVPNVRSMLNNVGTEGKITLDVIQENQRVLALKRNLAPQTFTKEDVKCILLDDAGYLTDTGFSTLLSDSRTWHTQMIIASQPRELEFIPSCYNIIRLQPSD